MNSQEAIKALRDALTRLRNECDLSGLRERAGFDHWLSVADESLAATVNIGQGASIAVADELAEFEAWLVCNGGTVDRTGFGEYRSAPTECAWGAWKAARADSIESQLDGMTIIKVRTLEAKGMKPVGIVLMAEDGKRATIDMGRVTLTGQNAERVALSDAEIVSAARKYSDFTVRSGDFVFAQHDLTQFANAILSAQADIGRAISKADLGNADGRSSLICPKCGVDRLKQCCRTLSGCAMAGVAQTLPPLTQPLIAEAARNDVDVLAQEIRRIDGNHRIIETTRSAWEVK